MCRSTAIVSSLVRLLASLACEGASSPLFSLCLSLSPSWMPMLMKETRLTRQKSIAQICTRDIERESLCGAGRGREREFDIARNESFQLGRTSSETHTSFSFPSIFIVWLLSLCCICSLFVEPNTSHRLVNCSSDEKEREISTMES